MSALWPQSPAIVVLSGPGLSREAVFAPFDPAGMPPGLSLEDVVTPQGFERAPARAREFYNSRRRQLVDEIAPNAAHDGLAVLEMVRKNEVLIVTRNIDDLHERAGSRAVIHTHGELLKARCTICTKVSDRHADITAESECPICGNAGHLRPHIVWVGEPPLRIETIYEALAHCRLFLSVGNAGGGEPARSFLAEARRAGARRIEFADERSAVSELFDECVSGPLTETVPEYVKKLIAEG
jgi:NAD-dependent deacetylase